MTPESSPDKVDWQKTLEIAQNKFKQNIFFSWNVEYNKYDLTKRDIYVSRESKVSGLHLDVTKLVKPLGAA